MDKDNMMWILDQNNNVIENLLSLSINLFEKAQQNQDEFLMQLIGGVLAQAKTLAHSNIVLLAPTINVLTREEHIIRLNKAVDTQKQVEEQLARLSSLTQASNLNNEGTPR